MTLRLPQYPLPFIFTLCAITTFFLFLIVFPRNLGAHLLFPQKLLFQQLTDRSSVDHVFNTTLGFEKVFVINLPSRTDHRDAMLLAAAVSNIDLTWIDGVKGETVLSKVLPAPGRERIRNEGNIGSWRAHPNVLATIVQRNISTALITEDDADWDASIKSQMRDFALSSRALTQPLASNPASYADPTYKFFDNAATAQEMHLPDSPATVNPTSSSYGDEWDILWLGHCGDIFPNASGIAKGRVVHLNDMTVPEYQHLRFPLSAPELQSHYPPHTRIVHHSHEGICSLMYAVNQASARSILYEMGVVKFSDPFDGMLRDIREGSTERRKHTCLTVLPQLFNHHRAAGPMSTDSDTSNHGDEIGEEPVAEMIRWSTRMNLARILMGETVLQDQFPDGS